MQRTLKISDLNKTYRGSASQALNNLSFSVREGEVFGLLGPNGAGKTTAISIITGLLAADSGSVDFNGLRIPDSLKEIKMKLGIVPQDIALYPTLTARENLRIFGMIYRLKRYELNVRIDEYLNLLGLAHVAEKQVKTFSGGMKRRLNLIAGLIHKPQFLLLDEPTVGIDVHSRNVILDYIVELGKQGISVVYTSHYLEEAERICNRVAIIDRGIKIAEGEPKELIAGHPGLNSLHDLFIELTGRELRD